MTITVCPVALTGTRKCWDRQCRLRHDVVRCKPCKCLIFHGDLRKHRHGEDHRLNCGFGAWKAAARRPGQAILPSPYPYVTKPKPSKKSARKLAGKAAARRPAQTILPSPKPKPSKKPARKLAGKEKPAGTGPRPNRQDISRCEPCGRSFPASVLGQHRSGKKHLRNVAAKGATNPVAPHQPPPPASNPPNSRTMSLPSAPSPAISAPNSIALGPRATVSHGYGLDFVVEGTENARQPSFSPVKHTIIIEKTQVLSSLSIPFVRLLPATGTPASWYGLSDHST